MNTRWLLWLGLVSFGCAERGGSPGGDVPKVTVPVRSEAGELAADPPPATASVAQVAEKPAVREVADGELASSVAKAHPDLAKAMLAAAAKALEATRASYEMGTETLSNLHHWSRQLALAERALAKTKEEEMAALVGYWKRSKRTYLKVRALYNTGSRGGEAERFSAAAYYLSEAELWIESAGGTVPENID